MDKYVCLNCGTENTSNYCHHCGQKAPHPEDLNVIALSRQLLSQLLETDSKIWISLKLLFSRPGELTKAFIAGKRMSYVSPFRLFLVFSALFFLWASKVYTSVTLGTVDDDFYEIESVLRFLFVVPCFSIACYFLVWGIEKRLGAWMVFSLHYYSFDFALSSIFAVPLAMMPGEVHQTSLNILVGTMILILGIYISRALVQVFEISRFRAIFSAVILLFIDVQFTQLVQAGSRKLMVLGF